MDIISLITGCAAGLIVALLFITRNFSLQKLLQQAEAEKTRALADSAHYSDQLQSALKELRTAHETLQTLHSAVAVKTRENQFLENALQTQKAELTDLQQQFSLQFEHLANQVLEEKSRKFTLHNQEKISEILAPLKEKIKAFEEKIEQTNKESINRNAGLMEQIRHLSTLNQVMSEEARNLTKALKGDNKIQGNWGEIILERILEKSGLRKGSEYFVQQSVRSESGEHLRPDILVQLPDNKNIIIDAKVSLHAYERYAHSEQEQERQQWLKTHIASLRQHIKGLSGKNYHQLYHTSSPDFVLLFIPVEPAFSVAIQQDHELFQEAFDRNIILVSTSTLLATLRTIASIWKQEYQNRHTIDIAVQAGKLYDKFVAFTEDLQQIGRRLQQSRQAYESAFNKLSSGNGNLVRSAQKLKDMGAKASKTLPESLTGEEDQTERRSINN